MLDRGGRHAVAASRKATSPEAATERRLFEDGAILSPPTAEPSSCSPSRGRCPSRRRPAYPLSCSPAAAARASGTPRPAPSKSAVLRRLAPSELYVEISPDDAARARHRPDDMVDVRSARARSSARAFVTNTVQPGPGVHADALRDDESPDLPRVRSLLAPARLQSVRRPHRETGRKWFRRRRPAPLRPASEHEIQPPRRHRTPRKEHRAELSAVLHKNPGTLGDLAVASL